MKSVVRNVCVFSTQWRELRQFGTITKHIWGWKIDEKYLKITNLTYFRPKRRGNVENKNKSPSQHQICCQNIRHQNFLWKHQIWCENIKSSDTAYKSNSATALLATATGNCDVTNVTCNENKYYVVTWTVYLQSSMYLRRRLYYVRSLLCATLLVGSVAMHC